MCGPAPVRAALRDYYVTITNMNSAQFTISPYMNGVSVGSEEAIGGWYATTNLQLLQLYSNAEFEDVRAGGNTADKNGNRNPPDAKIDAFFGFLTNANIPTIWTLDVKTGIPATNGLIANYILDKWTNNILWFDIGNEPDLYIGTTNFLDDSDWLKNGYEPTANAFHFFIGGPDTLNGTFTVFNYFADNISGDSYAWTNLYCLTHHYSPVGSRYITSLDDTNLCQDILSSNLDWATSGSTNFQYVFNQLNNAVYNNEDGNYFAITEFNPYVGNSTNSNFVGNSYGYALFHLDALNWFSHFNPSGAPNLCWGLFPHPTPNHSTDYVDPNGDLQATPQIYACRAFMEGNYTNYANGFPKALGVAIANNNNLNVTAYATKLGNDDCAITVVNKGFTENGVTPYDANVIVSIPNNPDWSNAVVSVMYLNQADGNIAATNGVTLGGDTLDGEHEWNGTWMSWGNLTGSDNHKYIGVTNATAAIIKIHK